MSLKETIRTDLTTAIKARDDIRSSTLRMVLSAITNAEVAGKEAKVLTDDEVMTVLTSENKKRREAAVAFEEGGRLESAAKERAEAAILAEYLPEQLSAEEIAGLVTAAIADLGVAEEGMRAMGKVMGSLQSKIKGRADGGVVSAEVKRQLA